MTVNPFYTYGLISLFALLSALVTGYRAYVTKDTPSGYRFWALLFLSVINFLVLLWVTEQSYDGVQIIKQSGNFLQDYFWNNVVLRVMGQFAVLWLVIESLITSIWVLLDRKRKL